MLSLFPTFFDYSAVAVTVLRVVVALIFITEGYKMLPQKTGAENTKNSFFPRVLSLAESLFGILLLIGLFTQVAGVALAIVSAKRMYLNKRNKGAAASLSILLFFISLSFLFFGPGLLSIDYPL